MTDLFNRTLDKLRGGPLGPLVRVLEAYPKLSAWVVLSVGMVALVVIEAWDVGLLPYHWVSLIIATVLVAGACVWIISWESEDENVSDESKPE